MEHNFKSVKYINNICRYIIMKPKNVFKDLWNNDTKQRTPNSQMNTIVGAKARERTSQGVNYFTDKDGINLRSDKRRHENSEVKQMKNKITGY